MRAIYVASAAAGFLWMILWKADSSGGWSDTAANRFAFVLVASLLILVIGAGLSEIAHAIRSTRP